MNTETAVETSELLNKRLFAIKNQRLGGDTEELALIIGTYLRIHSSTFLMSGRWQELDIRTREGLL